MTQGNVVAVDVDRPERRVPGRLYGRTATDITGDLRPTSNRVEYRRVLTRRQHWTMLTLGGLHIGLALAQAAWLLLPGHLPRLRAGAYVSDTVALVGLAVMVLLQLIVGLRTMVLVFFAARARDPIPMTPSR